MGILSLSSCSSSLIFLSENTEGFIQVATSTVDRISEVCVHSYHNYLVSVFLRRQLFSSLSSFK